MISIFQQSVYPGVESLQAVDNYVSMLQYRRMEIQIHHQLKSVHAESIMLDAESTYIGPAITGDGRKEAAASDKL